MKKKLFILFGVFLNVFLLAAQVTKTVTISTPGTLSNVLGTDKTSITNLEVRGTINAADFAVFKQMKALKVLDLGKANAVDNTVPASSFENSVVEELILPSSIKDLGSRTFAFSNIKKLVLPEGITEFSERLFWNTNMQGVDWSLCAKNVKVIGRDAFNGVKTDIDLSPFTKLEKVEGYTFSGCIGTVTYPAHLKSTFPWDFAAFKGKVILPQGLLEIANRSFDNVEMEELILPKSVKKLGEATFHESNIKKLILPEGISEFPERVFWGTNMQGVDWSLCAKNVKVIGRDAFNGVKTDIDLSPFTKLEKVEGYAFSGCIGTVTYPAHLKSTFPWDFAAFKGKVILPQGLLEIANRSFDNVEMEELILPKSIKIIGARAFENANISNGIDLTNLKALHTIQEFAFNKTTVSSLDFSNCTQLTTIQGGTFGNYEGHVILSQDMTELPYAIFKYFNGTVDLPKNLTKIGIHAFADSKMRTPLEIPESVEYIDSYAFVGAVLKHPFKLPAKLKTIKEYAFRFAQIAQLDFSKCPDLEEIGSFAFEKVTAPLIDISNNKNLKRFPQIGGYHGTFGNYEGHVILSQDMTELPYAIFKYFNGTVDLPENLTKIGIHAFVDSKMRAPLEIPESVEYIDSYAFVGAVLKHPFKLPAKLKTIKEYAFRFAQIDQLDFSRCPDLEEIGSFAFEKVTAPLIDISNNKNLKRFPQIGGYHGTFGNYEGHVILSQDMTELPYAIFKYFNGTVDLPENLTKIGIHAFVDSKMRAPLEIPESVEYIDSYAFVGAVLKHPFKLPAKLKTIKEYAFRFAQIDQLDFSRCPDLEEIGSFAFEKVTAPLIDISNNKNLKRFPQIGGYHGTFGNYEGHVILSQDMTELPYAIFKYFNGTVDLPENLTKIGIHAFVDSKMRAPLEIPESVEYIDSYAFVGAVLKHPFKLPAKLKTIKEYAFRFAQIDQLDFSRCPDLEEIGSSAFEELTAPLIDLSKNNNLNKFPQLSGYHGTFALYAGHVNLPETITILPERTFLNFKGTAKLPLTLKEIKSGAFLNSSIREIIIPDSVKIIGSNSFNGCTQLQEITSLNPTPPALGSNVFGGVDKATCVLNVPASSVSLYGTANQWKDFLNVQVSIPDSGPLHFYCEYPQYIYDNVKGDYEFIRIGEYLWINNNFNHDIPVRYTKWADLSIFDGGEWKYDAVIFGHQSQTPVTQYTLNRYLPCHLLDPSVYQLKDINDFKKYYGAYYNYRDIQYMGGYKHPQTKEYRLGYGRAKEGVAQEEKNWRIPSQGDFAQLFAMCHRDGEYISIHDAKIGLGARIGDNPLALHLRSNGEVVGWFDANTNKYGFNMMPGGGRISADRDTWCNGLGPIGSGCWSAQYGDLYHLFQANYFHTMEEDGTILCVGLHDYITFYRRSSTRWQNTRYCRRLTPEELGYELYINSELTDIKKLSPTETAPEGYTRLPNGYLRGLYVLHILNNPSPSKTVVDIVEVARKTANKNNSGEGLGHPIYDIVNESAPQVRSYSSVEKATVNNTFHDNFQIYVNPANNILNIKGVDNIQRVVILNLLGKTVKVINDTNSEINVSDLPVGTYILRVESDTNVYTQKIIKQ